jgi:hypothetical protein
MKDLEKQLEIWIERTNPALYDEETETKEYWSEMGSLSTLLIIKDWIKLNK